MDKKIKIGCLLSKKDKDHLGIPKDGDVFTTGQYIFTTISQESHIASQGPFDFILHKASDYIYGHYRNDPRASRILYELVHNPCINTIAIDNPQTVLGLADRSHMFSIMEKCKFSKAHVRVDVPKWMVCRDHESLEVVKSTLTFPIICKALRSGEGPDSHAMQLLFNPGQTDQLEVFPCVAQEFKNHDGFMVKIFVMGPKYFTCTRPSVRNFPVNGEPIEQTRTIRFDSHDVAKLLSKTFLNNYQDGFVLKNSVNGDHILDDTVIVEILRSISKQISFTFLGVDVLLTDNGKTYNLVDINYLPSYEGIAVEDRLKILITTLDAYVNNGGFINFWK